MKTAITIEARMTSTRLPGKVLKTIDDRPLLGIMIERVSRATCFDEIIIATTSNEEDDPVAQLAERYDVGCYRGDEYDVLGRLLSALQDYKVDVGVRLTGDCPLMDPHVVDSVYYAFMALRTNHDYASNAHPARHVPRGFDVEVFETKSLKNLALETETAEEREHVSRGFYLEKNQDKWNPVSVDMGLPEETKQWLVTVDYQVDFDLIRDIYLQMKSKNPQFGISEVINWIADNPDRQRSCQKKRKS